MNIDYLKNEYSDGEPIFLSELKSSSEGYLRQQVKRFADNGQLMRVCNGVYYLPYKTIFGTEGKMSIKKYIEKKFLKCSNQEIGYYTGLNLANQYGFTTQNPACYEVCSNVATTKCRKIFIDNTEIIVYKPQVYINKENIKILKFLDLLLCIEKYNELSLEVAKKKINKIMIEWNIRIDLLDKYLQLYPLKVYKSVYKYCGGFKNGLV